MNTGRGNDVFSYILDSKVSCEEQISRIYKDFSLNWTVVPGGFSALNVSESRTKLEESIVALSGGDAELQVKAELLVTAAAICQVLRKMVDELEALLPLKLEVSSRQSAFFAVVRLESEVKASEAFLLEVIENAARKDVESSLRALSISSVQALVTSAKLVVSHAVSTLASVCFFESAMESAAEGFNQIRELVILCNGISLSDSSQNYSELASSIGLSPLTSG